MAETLYATFNDPARAHNAARDLVQQGVKSEEISLLIKNDGPTIGDVQEETRSTTPMQEQWGNSMDDPMSNSIRQSSVARIERGVDAELNPSPGSDSIHQSQSGSHDAIEATPASDTDDGMRFSRGFNAISETAPSDTPADPDGQTDMAKGVAKGAGIGLGIGAVAALATLLIPGFGLVIGGGAIAAAAAALAASAATGAIAGGIVGLLKEHGVPEERAAAYDQVYRSGGAVLAVTVLRPEERPGIEETLARNGADAVEAHQAFMA